MLYERQKDRANEKKVIKRIETAWGVESHKMKMAYGLDYMLLKGGNLHSFVEVKCRNNAQGDYPTYAISLMKFLQANRFTQSTVKPCYLIVKWTDKLGFLDMGESFYQVGVGGRTDRNNPNDIEPIVFIPNNKFEIIY